MDYFADLKKIGEINYAKTNNLDKVLNINLKNRENFQKSWISNINISKNPIPPEIDDLTRLHYLITNRKVTTILEFGVGASTKVFSHAMQINYAKYSKFTQNLRRNNLFEVHSVDNSKKWLHEIRILNLKHIYLHYSKVRMTNFNDRICTEYDLIPNICPDFIYLDAPDQYSVIGKINGISTRNKDRLPMSCDILKIEHFLLPGTLIVIDGRTANARFLKCNLQRKWSYNYYEEYDQHFFELTEFPLGPVNKIQLDFTRS